MKKKITTLHIGSYQEPIHFLFIAGIYDSIRLAMERTVAIAKGHGHSEEDVVICTSTMDIDAAKIKDGELFYVVGIYPTEPQKETPGTWWLEKLFIDLDEAMKFIGDSKTRWIGTGRLNLDMSERAPWIGGYYPNLEERPDNFVQPEVSK